VELNEYKKDDFPIIDITKHPNKKELERIEEIYKELKAVLSKLRAEGDVMIEEAKDLERMKKLKKQLPGN
jgi:chromosome segregation ATPase